MSRPRRQPYIWVTWLSKIMAGEQSCIWASWFKAHHQDYNKLQGSFDLARWNIEHTRLLTEYRAELGRNGATVRVETQNSFQYGHASGAVIAGKPDIVALRDSIATVCDCKTGRPKTSDRVQVMMYMYLLPVCFPELAAYTVEGRIIYPGSKVDIPPSAVDDRFARNLDYFVSLTSAADAPCCAPSHAECRFCDITRIDCPNRYER